MSKVSLLYLFEIMVIRGGGGGAKGVRKPQNNTQKKKSKPNRIFAEYRNRTSSSLSVATSTTSAAIVASRLYELISGIEFHETDASLTITVNHIKC